MRRPDTSSVEMASTASSPAGAQRAIGSWRARVELGRVADLGGHAGHGDAPTGVVDRIEVVDLEGDHRVLQRGVEPAAPTGAHQDALAVEMEVDGQHRRQRADVNPMRPSVAEASSRRHSSRSRTSRPLRSTSMICMMSATPCATAGPKVLTFAST